MLGVKAMIWHPRGRLPFSPGAGVSWRSASARATCLARMLPQGQPSHHPAPDEDCNCGIHALYGMGFLLEYVSHPDVFFYGRHRCRLFTAILEPFGKVIEHEYGWRAIVCWRRREPHEGAEGSPHQGPYHNQWQAASHDND